jgi:NAD-dependent deacetylase
VSDINVGKLAPRCLDPNCNSILKPDFIFFGEGIPEDAYRASINAAKQAEVFILIGTSGEIMPASSIPIIAKQNGSKIIEINPSFSSFTNSSTDIFLQTSASEGLGFLVEKLARLD